MGSDSVDFPIIHHNDSIGIFDRIDPLGNDDRCRSGFLVSILLEYYGLSLYQQR